MTAVKNPAEKDIFALATPSGGGKISRDIFPVYASFGIISNDFAGCSGLVVNQAMPERSDLDDIIGTR
ncbi:hypothetical protein AVEN_11542-1, partial [Araneus ventricosus]